MPEHSRPAAEQSKDLLLQALVRGHFHLVQRSGEWCIQGAKDQSVRPLGHKAQAFVKALRDRGHLVERTGGGLEPLAASQAASPSPSQRRAVPLGAADVAGLAGPGFNDAESPLAWLRSRKDKTGRPLISAEQFLAGERLRSDYERSCMARRVTASWDCTPGRSGSNAAPNLADSAIAAKQRFHDAINRVGPELASILVQVCCLAAGIEQAERILDLPQRSGKAVLGLALTGLARHYGFLAANRVEPFDGIRLFRGFFLF